MAFSIWASIFLTERRFVNAGNSDVCACNLGVRPQISIGAIKHTTAVGFHLWNSKAGTCNQWMHRITPELTALRNHSQDLLLGFLDVNPFIHRKTLTLANEGCHTVTCAFNSIASTARHWRHLQVESCSLTMSFSSKSSPHVNCLLALSNKSLSNCHSITLCNELALDVTMRKKATMNIRDFYLQFPHDQL